MAIAKKKKVVSKVAAVAQKVAEPIKVEKFSAKIKSDYEQHSKFSKFKREK